MKRMLAAAGRCYNGGKSRRAIELAEWGLWFAGEPQEGTTPEIRRFGIRPCRSDVVRVWPTEPVSVRENDGH